MATVAPPTTAESTALERFLELALRALALAPPDPCLARDLIRRALAASRNGRTP